MTDSLALEKNKHKRCHIKNNNKNSQRIQEKGENSSNLLWYWESLWQCQQRHLNKYKTWEYRNEWWSSLENWLVKVGLRWELEDRLRNSTGRGTQCSSLSCDNQWYIEKSSEWITICRWSGNIHYKKNSERNI